MKSRTGQLFIHFFGCIVFIALPVIFNPNSRDITGVFHNPNTIRDILHNLLLLLFFYFNFYVLIQGLFFKKRYFYFIVAILICYLLIAFLPSMIIPFETYDRLPPPGPPGSPPRPFFGDYLFRLQHNFFLFLAVFFFSLMLKISTRWKRTEKEKLSAELSYLKAQVNPHFLFNSLNSIYSLALQKADNTADAIVKLSGLMRYTLSDAGHDFVPLEKEINYLVDYIELQKIRLADTAKIRLIIDGRAEGKQIAPLILIPFIENAFKYGVNPEEDASFDIHIMITDYELIMKVRNKKVCLPNYEESQEGVGISNARQRLELLYPAGHHLTIKDDLNDFLVELSIQLK